MEMHEGSAIKLNFYCHKLSAVASIVLVLVVLTSSTNLNIVVVWNILIDIMPTVSSLRWNSPAVSVLPRLYSVHRTNTNFEVHTP